MDEHINILVWWESYLNTSKLMIEAADSGSISFHRIRRDGDSRGPV